MCIRCVAALQQERGGHGKAHLAQQAGGAELAHGEGHVEHPPGLVWHLQHVQVALQLAVLTGCAVDGDQGGGEALGTLATVRGEGPAIEGEHGAVMPFAGPAFTRHADECRVEAIRAERVHHGLRAFQADDGFSGVSTAQDGDKG